MDNVAGKAHADSHKSMGQYAALLSANPAELDLLFKEMLIAVTNFFRDAEAWDELDSDVLPGLFPRAGTNGRFRAWVRREGVTEAAGKLQRLGVIHYRRGHIEVLDRPKLELLCCECYAVVKRETDRLMQ